MRSALVYPSWHPSRRHPLPARSHLYHLQPLAAGSPQVESLTSYLVRLAEAHDVTVGALLNQELLPTVRKAFNRRTYRLRGKPESTFVYASYTLNGTAQCAQDWVTVLEGLTGMRPLRDLSMLAYRQVISGRDLIRQERAWCPHCFEDWRESGNPVYDPLLWSLAAVSTCTTHGTTLETSCPHCEQEMHLVAARSRSGCCCRCHRWLGRRYLTSDSSSVDRTEFVTAVAIGELLSRAANLAQPPSREHLLNNVRFCIEDLADGSTRRFSVATGIPFHAMVEWTASNRLLRLSYLVRICTLLGVPPLSLISHRITSDHVDCARVQEMIRQLTAHIPARRLMPGLRSTLIRAAQSPEPVSLHVVAAQLGYSGAQSLRRRDPVLCDQISANYRAAVTLPNPNAGPRRCFPSDDVIEKALTRALNRATPPRLEAITKELGFCCSVSLYKRFPELCRAFAKRNELSKQQRIDEVRATVAAAIQESPPPTMQAVASRVHSTVETLKNRFPNLCAQLLAALPVRNKILAEQRRAGIRRALAEDPAPSLDTVATRVGHSVQWLREFDPDVARQIGQRYRALKTIAATVRRAAFRAEIRAAVIDLTRRGLVPSRKRVLASIANPTMRSSKILGHQIAATVLELKSASGALLLDGHEQSPVPRGWEPSDSRAALEP
jgi:hypothetical protein